jgi:hypothetical protein
MAPDSDEIAVFMRSVRHVLSVIEEEMSQSLAGRQRHPTAEQLRDVQRNLIDMTERPHWSRSYQTLPKWDGRATGLVREWPEDNDVRREVLRLWTQYTRALRKR